MRDTDGLQTTISCGPVNRAEQTLTLELSLQMTLPMPPQDEHLPDRIEAHVHQAGLELQRRLFQVLIEKADHELVLQQRHIKAGAGIQRKGTRPFTFKTIFGEVTVGRSRILQKKDGPIEVPSALAWGTSHQMMITGNLRDAVCDQMSDQSTRQSLAEVCQYARGRGSAGHQHDHRHRPSRGRATDRRATPAGSGQPGQRPSPSWPCSAGRRPIPTR